MMHRTAIFPLVAKVGTLNLPCLYQYDVNKSGVNDKKAGQNTNLTGSSRGQVAPKSAPSRVNKYQHNHLISAILLILIKKYGKRISRDNDITSCRSHINHRHTLADHPFSLAALIAGFNILNLIHPSKYDTNKSGLNDKKSGQKANLTGSSRGQVAPKSAPSRVNKYLRNPLISAILLILIKKHGKRISRDNDITSCRSHINHRHTLADYPFSLAALIAGFNILNLIHTSKYDTNKSGLNDKKSGQKAYLTGSSRGQVAPKSAPSRVNKYLRNPLISGILLILIKKHGKRISRDIYITSCRSQS